MRALLLTLAVCAVVYAAFLLALVAAGRGAQARAWARLVPDCAVLVKRLLGDPRVPRWRKLTLVLLVGYLACPIDLVPDVIPVAGALDDAILVAFVLRGVLRAGGGGLLREHWPGTPASLALVERLVMPRPVPASSRG
jgi:uncharacterized membrane protein YkvA (DUF1232 family)